MPHEYEMIPTGSYPCLNLFLVRLQSRCPHLHRELELGLILEGRLTLRHAGQGYRLEKDEFYLVNSMKPHEFTSVGEGTLVLAVQVSPRFLEPFIPDASMHCFKVKPPLEPFFPKGSEKARELREAVLDLAVHYLSAGGEDAMTCFYLLSRLLLLLDRNLPRQVLTQNDYEMMRRQTDRMVSILDEIDRHFQQKLLLEDIARQYGLTMPYVSHLFKNILGISFQEYLKEKRFEHALELLNTTSKTILDIAIESGFSDLRYMTKAFREKYGCTPKEYRRQHPSMLQSTRSSAENRQELLHLEESLLIVRELLGTVPDLEE